MNTTIDHSRMTVRLPTDLREALEQAVRQGSSASVTAEIISRLRKSFDLNPLNNASPNELIKQCAATILDTVEKLDQSLVQNFIMKRTAFSEPSAEEKHLLEQFNQLPKPKRKMAINLFLEMIEMMKDKKA